MLLTLLAAAKVNGQTGDIVKDQGITTELHRANIGKILFTDKVIPLQDQQPVDFLSSYTLTNKSNLYMTVFLAHSNTNYLHRLAPGISADSLVKMGNYQFSFFIDGKLIYETNLYTGAPRAPLQNTETAWSKPLIDNQHEGALCSQSAWNRFTHYGGDSVLTDGPHTLKIEFRDWIKAPDLKIGSLIASGELKLQVKRVPVINLSGVKLAAVKPYNGFAVSQESFDRDKIKTLKANIDADVFKHITGVVVVKNGQLLVEEYFNGSGRDSLHDVRSVGKSFTSTLAGMALRDGYLKSTKQTLGEFYDLRQFGNYSADKEKVSLEELLTMTSGFYGDDDDGGSPGQEENMYPTDNWVKFTLDLPMNIQKYQGHWHYFTAGMILLGDVLNKSVPGGLETYASNGLFKPLGITNYTWQYTPQKVVNTAGGIQMNALDFAKYGQLYKNGGLWQGKQILPADWVKQTFTRHKAITGRTNEYYGYLFWNKTYRVNGKDYETFYCAGNGGNSIFIFKDQPLVVVITATAFGAIYGHTQVDRMMEQYILPALIK